MLRWLGSRGTSVGQKRGAGRAARPRLEQLEERDLPASWTPIGPAPLQYEGLDGNDPIETGPFTGRISALAYSPDFDGHNHAALFAGAANKPCRRPRPAPSVIASGTT